LWDSGDSGGGGGRGSVGSGGATAVVATGMHPTRLARCSAWVGVGAKVITVLAKGGSVGSRVGDVVLV